MGEVGAIVQRQWAGQGIVRQVKMGEVRKVSEQRARQLSRQPKPDEEELLHVAHSRRLVRRRSHVVVVEVALVAVFEGMVSSG